MNGDRLLLSVVLLAACGMSPPTAQPADVPISTTQPSQTSRAVTFLVVDAVTKQPVTDFSYFATIRAPRGVEADWRQWMPDRPTPWEKLVGDDGDSIGWIAVKSVDGAFTLHAPASCQMALRICAAGYVTDDSDRDYELKRADHVRRFLHELDRGTTLRGKAIDEETGKPIRRVHVSPAYFRSWSGWSTEAESTWSVQTDENGRFEISGVRWGILARHPDYVQSGFSIPQDHIGHVQAIDEFTISLCRTTAISVTGIVQDPTGQPVEGAIVDTDCGARSQTKMDGSFVLEGLDSPPTDRAFTLNVTKPGYSEWCCRIGCVSPEPMVITLRPLLAISGCVFDPDGKPVRRFTVKAGQCRHPPDYKCKSETVDNHEGRFTIGIETNAMDPDPENARSFPIEREHWVGVRAEGLAAWEGWVTYAPKVEPLSVTLSHGVEVSGELKGIGTQLAEGEAVLLPEYPGEVEPRLDENAAQQFSALRVPIGKDGRFHIEHVRPDKYSLVVGGKGITARVIPVEVPQDGLDVGAVEVVGLGRVVGKAFTWRCEPWAFGTGAVAWQGLGGLALTWFRLDEDGGFVLEDVPAGKCSVGVMTGGGCMVTLDSQEIEVNPGETTHVVINDPETGNAVRFRLTVGDGSEQQRRTGAGASGSKTDKAQDQERAILDLKLTRVSERAEDPASEQEHTLRGDGEVEFIWNIPPGEYRLRLYDWRNSRYQGDGLVHEDRLTVERSKKVITLQLGAGAVKGKMAIERWAIDQPKVLAVEMHGRTHSRRVQCSDDDGSFCLRYLPPGEYVLYAHKEAQGWSRLPPVKVDNEVVEVGGLVLQPGGTIRGAVSHHLPAPKRASLRLVEASGAFVNPICYGGRSGEEFMVSNVWPGEWSVRAECEGKVIAEQKVVLKGTETVRADLIAENE